MGFWDWFYGYNDPLRDVEPDLRQFLEQQSPKDYKPAENISLPDETPYRTRLGLTTGNTLQESLAKQEAAAEQAPTEPEDQNLPKQSLFQDGRYKDVWKTFRSQQESEDAGKSDQEKLLDIVHAYRDRQSELKQAATENCSDEQWDCHNCFNTGGMRARMTMCRDETRELERCVTMQTKFLKALGYLTMYERPDEETEKIQMHAYKLYQQMKVQEKAMKEAKEKGLPEPRFDPMIKMRDNPTSGDSSSKSAPVTADSSSDYRPAPPTIHWDQLPRNLREKFTKEHLEGLEGPELEVTKHELDQELAYKNSLVSKVGERYYQERKARLKRLEEGTERFSDKIKRWLDFRDWSEIDKREAEGGKDTK